MSDTTTPPPAVAENATPPAPAATETPTPAVTAPVVASPAVPVIDTTAKVERGASPANPHLFGKIIEEGHELENRIGKIVEQGAEFIVLEFERAGSWIKAKIHPSKVQLVAAPEPSPSSSTVTTTTAPGA